MQLSWQIKHALLTLEILLFGVKGQVIFVLKQEKLGIFRILKQTKKKKKK